MGAVRRTESVVAVDIAVGSELLGHFLTGGLELSLLRRELFIGQMNALLLVILLDLAVLGLVEAGILEQRDFAGLERGNDIVGRHAVGNELDFQSELLRKLFGDGPEREGRIVGIRRRTELAALRTSEVAHEHEAAALLKNIIDGGKRRDDARIVRDLAAAVLGHRHVEVDAHNDALALEFDIS